MGASIVAGHKDGARTEVQVGRKPRRRLRGELALSRDAALYREVCGGRPVPEIAVMFRLHRRTVYKRLDAIPMRVKRAWEAQFRAEGVLKRSIVAEIVRQSEAKGVA